MPLQGQLSIFLLRHGELPGSLSGEGGSPIPGTELSNQLSVIKVVQALKKNGFYENTLIAFTTDNGKNRLRIRRIIICNLQVARLRWVETTGHSGEQRELCLRKLTTRCSDD